MTFLKFSLTQLNIPGFSYITCSTKVASLPLLKFQFICKLEKCIRSKIFSQFYNFLMIDKQFSKMIIPIINIKQLIYFLYFFKFYPETYVYVQTVIYIISTHIYMLAERTTLIFFLACSAVSWMESMAISHISLIRPLNRLQIRKIIG